MVDLAARYNENVLIALRDGILVVERIMNADSGELRDDWAYCTLSMRTPLGAPGAQVNSPLHGTNYLYIFSLV